MPNKNLVIAAVVIGTSTTVYAEQADVPEAYEEDLAAAYATQGTLEIGGSLGAAITSSTSTITASPEVGYFIIDRVQLSGRFTFAYTRTEMSNEPVTTSNVGALVFEPSYHYPLTRDLLASTALGIGGGYDGTNLDFEIIPAVGVDIVTARANVITPQVRVPILIGESHGDDGNVGADVGLGVEVGVTTTW